MPGWDIGVISKPMTRKKKRHSPPDTEQPATDTAQAALEDAENAPSDPAAQLKDIQAQRDDFRDKFLRAQAECANITKRLHQQHAEVSRLAGMDLARSLLPVLDSLQRMLASFDETAKDDPVHQGVQLITDDFLKAFLGQGIVPIESVGRPFDPTLHEAMMQDHDSDLPIGTVTREFQRGYKMHDRVLRPAKVAVAAEKTDDRRSEDADTQPASE